MLVKYAWNRTNHWNCLRVSSADLLTKTLSKKESFFKSYAKETYIIKNSLWNNMCVKRLKHLKGPKLSWPANFLTKNKFVWHFASFKLKFYSFKAVNIFHMAAGTNKGHSSTIASMYGEKWCHMRRLRAVSPWHMCWPFLDRSIWLLFSHTL